MKYYFSIKHFLQIHHHWLHLKLDRTLTDWLTQQAFMSDIPSLMHASSITVVWRVILLFMWFVLSKVLAFTTICNTHKEQDFVFISRIFNSHRFIRCFPFWFINPREYLPVQFSFRLMLSLATHLHSRFLLAIYLLIFKPSVLVCCRNSVPVFFSS